MKLCPMKLLGGITICESGYVKPFGVAITPKNVEVTKIMCAVWNAEHNKCGMCK